MKAISIKQPWAWAILHAGKNVENRTWATKYRGPLAIHAGKAYDHEGEAFLRNVMGLDVPADLPKGGIVGVVEVMDCVTSPDQVWGSPEWFSGPYGWVLGSAIPLTFALYKGKLGFMEVPDALIASLRPGTPASSKGFGSCL